MLRTTPAFTSGGSPSADTSKLVNDAHALLANCGFTMSPSKVSRLVRRYNFQVAPNGWAFIDYLINAVKLTEEQRRRVLADPITAKVIAYADPTGETAVNNIIRNSHRTGDDHAA
jgi:hypothetical protein